MHTHGQCGWNEDFENTLKTTSMKTHQCSSFHLSFEVTQHIHVYVHACIPKYVIMYTCIDVRTQYMYFFERACVLQVYIIVQLFSILQFPYLIYYIHAHMYNM